MWSEKLQAQKLSHATEVEQMTTQHATQGYQGKCVDCILALI